MDARMETSLHRQLKELYAGQGARLEVRLGSYRIDVVRQDTLVEIQHGSLAAIRAKVLKLLADHRLLVVKPLVVSKRLIQQDAKGGRVVTRRMSPRRGTLLDLFDELIYFIRVFPHENLTLETPLVEIEEWRYPGTTRRRRRRRNATVVEDQKLIAVRETHRFATAADFARLVSGPLPVPFHTGHLAKALGVDRWIAQRIAYCFRYMGTTREVGKSGNARLYEFAPAPKAGRKPAA
jgi:hypothetical protein